MNFGVRAHIRMEGYYTWVSSILFISCVSLFFLNHVSQHHTVINYTIVQQSNACLPGEGVGAISQRKRNKTSPWRHVALIGKFNYNTDVSIVKFWIEKWQPIFTEVKVYGPFSDQTIKELKNQTGAQVYSSFENVNFL